MFKTFLSDILLNYDTLRLNQINLFNQIKNVATEGFVDITQIRVSVTIQDQKCFLVDHQKHIANIHGPHLRKIRVRRFSAISFVEVL